MNTTATATTAAAFDSMNQKLDRMIRSLESCIQRFEELFPINSVESVTSPSTFSTPTPRTVLTAPPAITALMASASSTPPTASTSTTPPPTPTPTPTSINASTPCFSTTGEPLHALPAGCSTMGRSHDERAIAPVTATSAPSSTTTQRSSGAEDDQPQSVSVRAIADKPSSSSVDDRLVFDKMPIRYTNSASSPQSVGVVLLCSVVEVHEAQEVFQTVTIQSALMLWLPFSDSLEVVQLRHPWPPPTPASIASDSGKYREVRITYATVELQPPPWPSFISPITQLCFSSWFNFSGDAQPKLTWPYPLLNCPNEFAAVQLNPTPWPFCTSPINVNCREYGAHLQQFRIIWSPQALGYLIEIEQNQDILMQLEMSWFFMLSSSVDMSPPYQGTILFQVEALFCFKLRHYRVLLEVQAHSIPGRLQYETGKNSKHRVHVPYLQWSIIWPPLAFVLCSRDELQ